ncbi:MAG: hypothetical protein II821_00605 [Treponema sp.]|nr:hypothetical protein [Treponema sp.]
MKRLNLIKLAFITLTGASLFLSCKSTPDLAPVDAFELLDGDAAMYLTIPVQNNQSFVSSAIQKVARVAQNDAEKIAGRLDMAYVAVGSDGRVQLSCGGNIPTTFIGMALNEKNGWNAGAKDGQVFYTSSATGFELCIPSDSNVFLASDIGRMAKRYNKIAYSVYSEENLKKNKNADTILAYKNSSEKLLSEFLKEYDYKFLHENISSNIMLYSPNPKFFLRNFLGAVDVRTTISSIYGTVAPYNKVNGYDYTVTLVLNLSDSRTVKATEALLKVGLFGMASKISQTGQSQITIVDLLLTKNQILSLVR